MGLHSFFQSALSVDGMLGHASQLLLILSMLMTRMMWLRVLAMASSLLSITCSVQMLASGLRWYRPACNNQQDAVATRGDAAALTGATQGTAWVRKCS